MSAYSEKERFEEECLDKLLALHPPETPLEASIGRLALIDRESAGYYARERETLLKSHPELTEALHKLVIMSIAISEQQNSN